MFAEISTTRATRANVFCNCTTTSSMCQSLVSPSLSLSIHSFSPYYPSFSFPSSPFPFQYFSLPVLSVNEVKKSIVRCTPEIQKFTEECAMVDPGAPKCKSLQEAMTMCTTRDVKKFEYLKYKRKTKQNKKYPMINNIQ
jgi:hypothetical protein